MYAAAGLAFALNRLPRFAANAKVLLAVGALFCITGLLWHSAVLLFSIVNGGSLSLTLGNTISLVAWQLALIGLLSSINSSLRGLAGGMLVLAAVGALQSYTGPIPATVTALSWQVQTHIIVSLFAYGLLAIGAIVAVYALVQDNRLRSGQLGSVNQLFAPLETNEQLLYGIATAGFVTLLAGVLSGLTFVDDFFAQHLVHKSTLSILALTLFGILLAGRIFAGWRGRRAVYLYLGGFIVLGLAYFGSRFILEQLGRSWA